MLRAHRHLFGGAAAVAAITVAALGYDLARMHDKVIADGLREAESLSRAFEAHTARTLQLIDSTLLWLASDAAALDPDDDGQRHRFAETFDALSRRPDPVKMYAFVDRSGKALAATQLPSPRVDISDRPYFVAHRDRTVDGLEISPPLQSRIDGNWIITLTRRVERRGDFAGISLASVDPRSFADIYGAANVRQNGAVSLVHRNGTVIAGAPHYERYVGRSIAGGELFRNILPQSESGSARVRTSAGPPDMLVAYRSVPGMPLVMIVGFVTDDLLEAWRATALVYGGVALALMVALAVLVGQVIRGRKRKEALRALQAAHENAERENAAAEAEMRVRTRFLAHMCHELRTPLNAVIGFSELLMVMRGRGDRSSKGAEYAADIHGAGRHLLEIVDDILSLARLEAGASAVVADDVDLADLARGCVDLIKLDAVSKEIAVTVVGAASVRSDARALRRIILNLLSNAVKFVRRSGSVTVTLSTAAEGAQIRVRDDGIGIAAAELPHVFAPFARGAAEVARRYDGTGLGLHVCQQFVRALGGTISVASTPGAGTTVTVLIPDIVEERIQGSGESRSTDTGEEAIVGASGRVVRHVGAVPG